MYAYSIQHKMIWPKKNQLLHFKLQKSCAWTILFTDEKRISLLFFPIFFFIYLFIFTFNLSFILTSASIYIFFPVFPLYSIIFCSTCYVAISFVTREWLHEYFVTRLWMENEIDQGERNSAKIVETIFEYISEYFVLYFERN